MNDNVKNLVKIGKSILRIGVGAGLLYWVCRSIENKNRENEEMYNKGKRDGYDKGRCDGIRDMKEAYEKEQAKTLVNS